MSKYYVNKFLYTVDRDPEGLWRINDLALESGHAGVTNLVEGNVLINAKENSWSANLHIEAAPATLQPVFRPGEALYTLLQRVEIRSTPLVVA